jgi:hypothetical protein
MDIDLHTPSPSQEENSTPDSRTGFILTPRGGRLILDSWLLYPLSIVFCP